MTAFVSVLGGVVEQVHHDLFQPGGVGVQPDRLWRQRHGEFMLALLDQRTSRLHRTFHDAAHGDPLLAKLNPAGGDTGNLQQVINKM